MTYDNIQIYSFTGFTITVITSYVSTTVRSALFSEELVGKSDLGLFKKSLRQLTNQEEEFQYLREKLLKLC